MLSLDAISAGRADTPAASADVRGNDVLVLGWDEACQLFELS